MSVQIAHIEMTGGDLSDIVPGNLAIARIGIALIGGGNCIVKAGVSPTEIGRAHV